jgi:hypothetical protein
MTATMPTEKGGHNIRRRFAPLVAFVGMLALGGSAFVATPGAANTREATYTTVDVSFVISDLCDFRIRAHVAGTYKEASYFDSSGRIVKSILTAFGGPFTVTWSAHGITTTTQAETEVIIVTFNPDGSVKTRAHNGLIYNFTIPGAGSVWMDVGRIVFDGDGNIIFESRIPSLVPW